MKNWNVDRKAGDEFIETKFWEKYYYLKNHIEKWDRL